MSFSFSEAQDAEYARGWPHVRAVVAPGDLDASVDAACRILTAVDPPWIPTRTRAMCLAILRGVEVTPQEQPPDALARMARPEPLDDVELETLLDRWLSQGRYWFQIEELVLALEAAIGSDAAGLSIARRLAHGGYGDPGDLGAFFGSARVPARPAALFCLGFVALRSEATRRAIAALRDDAGPAQKVADLVLGGAEACRRHGVRHLFAALFAGDDPRYLAQLAATERHHSSLTPRLAYLGGEPLLAHYVARARAGIPPNLALQFVEQFGTIRHPHTIELMRILATRKTPRERALAWLRDHADFVEAQS